MLGRRLFFRQIQQLAAVCVSVDASSRSQARRRSALEMQVVLLQAPIWRCGSRICWRKYGERFRTSNSRSLKVSAFFSIRPDHLEEWCDKVCYEKLQVQSTPASFDMLQPVNVSCTQTVLQPVGPCQYLLVQNYLLQTSNRKDAHDIYPPCWSLQICTLTVTYENHSNLCYKIRGLIFKKS